jgi:hypothetical protein
MSSEPQPGWLREAFALVAHHRNGDTAAVAELGGRWTNPADAEALTAALCGAVNLALEQRPHDPDSWITANLLRLADVDAPTPTGEPQPAELATVEYRALMATLRRVVRADDRHAAAQQAVNKAQRTVACLRSMLAAIGLSTADPDPGATAE